MHPHFYLLFFLLQVYRFLGGVGFHDAFLKVRIRVKTEINEKDYFCIVNFGPKPTFGDYRQSLEAYILDFDKNIYDEILSIEFLCKIRDQIKFDSIDDLKNQIQKDREKAESLLKNYE